MGFLAEVYVAVALRVTIAMWSATWYLCVGDYMYISVAILCQVQSLR